jgi:hypothetical protein
MRPARASSCRPNQAGEPAQVGHPPVVKRTSLDKQSDPGAMQTLATTAKHVEAVPDFVERRRNELLMSLSRFREGVTRIQVSAQRPNVDRGETCSDYREQRVRVVSEFRRVASR